MKRDQQVTYGIITKCADFSETALKLMLSLNLDNIQESDLRDLWMIHFAQLRYLQEEYSHLLVQGRFDRVDPTIAKLFRSMQKQTSGFTDSGLDILQKSIDIAGAAAKHPNYTSAGHTVGQSQPFRGRGRYNRGPRGDIFSSFTGRSFSRRGGVMNTNNRDMLSTSLSDTTS